MEEARTATRDLVRRAQREAKAGAALLYPEPATIEEMQASLAPGEALVFYAETHPTLSTLVITKGSVRLRELGKIEKMGNIKNLLEMVPGVNVIELA